MADWLIILLLPCAAWSGWWLAMRKEARDLRADKTRAAYFEGVGFLLNDQTDRAVDVFIHMADLDQQMLDNQLTLGSLFRKRGELDRALHLHQQLRNHSQLSDAQRMAVDYELAEDYAAAGMYNQAQALFEQLLAEQYREAEVMPALAHLYERTKQWQAALELSAAWQAKGYGARGTEISHYYCELAQQAGDDATVAHYLQQALAADRDCVRANRMRGQLLLRQGEYVNAIHALQSIGETSAALLPDVLPDIAAAYQGSERSFSLDMPTLTAQGEMTYTRKTLHVKIPKGIIEGQQIRLRGQGLPGFNGGENGDLYLKIRFREDPQHYVKDRKDVYQRLDIAPWTAVLGGTVEVATPAGKLGVNIPAGSRGGQNLRLKGKGIPAKEAGDLYLIINIPLPETMSEADRAAWQQLAEHYGVKG